MSAIFDSFRTSRRNKKAPSIEEEADAKLDEALAALATATKENTAACDRVKRVSSGKLKIVSIMPPGE
jgi:hypothetical protein